MKGIESNRSLLSSRQMLALRLRELGDLWFEGIRGWNCVVVDAGEMQQAVGRPNQTDGWTRPERRQRPSSSSDGWKGRKTGRKGGTYWQNCGDGVNGPGAYPVW